MRHRHAPPTLRKRLTVPVRRIFWVLLPPSFPVYDEWNACPPAVPFLALRPVSDNSEGHPRSAYTRGGQVGLGYAQGQEEGRRQEEDRRRRFRPF
jgi:hypothetical protein